MVSWTAPQFTPDIAIPQLTDVTLNPTTSSIMVSWTAPQFTPDNYSVSVNCSRLCDNAPTTGMQLVSDGGATSHTIHSGHLILVF